MPWVDSTPLATRVRRIAYWVRTQPRILIAISSCVVMNYTSKSTTEPKYTGINQWNQWRFGRTWCGVWRKRTTASTNVLPSSPSNISGYANRNENGGEHYLINATPIMFFRISHIHTHTPRPSTTIPTRNSGRCVGRDVAIPHSSPYRRHPCQLFCHDWMNFKFFWSRFDKKFLVVHERRAF